jgi:hypothetical protein
MRFIESVPCICIPHLCNLIRMSYKACLGVGGFTMLRHLEIFFGYLDHGCTLVVSYCHWYNYLWSKEHEWDLSVNADINRSP